MGGHCLCPRHDPQAPQDFPSRFDPRSFDPFQQKILAFAVRRALAWQPLYTACAAWQASATRHSLYHHHAQWPALTQRDFEAFFLLYPCFLDVVTDWIPHGSTLILAVERLNAPIQSDTVEAAQQWCMAYANQATRGVYHAQFLTYLTQAHAPDAALETLADTMVEAVPETVMSTNQKRTSIAGAVHQLLVQRLLESLGWQVGVEFRNLNSSTRGDLQVFTRDRSQSIITEVKSLNARERLRGSLNRATAAHQYVVGLGFFHDAHEFSQTATGELIQTRALALYMPSTTLAQLTPYAQQALNAFQHPFYRPLTRYAEDMRTFHNTGLFV